jgi:hypothetical protein
MSEWEPIATAPQGVPLLVYGAKRLLCTVARYTKGDGWEQEGTSEWHTMYTPTHWMHLPDRPDEVPVKASEGQS